jgi:D-glycero-D-manno-heptose 1,7-bisphosphate phosphatase
LLEAEGVVLEAVYYCPHHPDFTGPCDCRKPGLALFEQAAAELSLDLRRSVFLGDRLKDVLPARALGGQGYLVRTGYGADQESQAPAEIIVVDDLQAAAATILQSRIRVTTQGQE